MTPPLIGISGRRVAAGQLHGMPEVVKSLPLDVYFSDYSAKIAAAGGLPVQLPQNADPTAIADRCEGLVLTGGGDVDPRLYGSLPNTHSMEVDPGRDAFELSLLRAALDREIPVLGICRGCQLINVGFGGTLVEHLPADTGEGHSFMGHQPDQRRHRVSVTGGTLLKGLYGRELLVNSFHHQAIGRPGRKVVVAASADDGVAEAIEVTGHRVVGVQWHPELFSEPDPIFTWLIQQATEARRRDKTREIFA